MCAGCQCYAATAREAHRPLSKTLAPGEIMSEIPESEKQNLLCFGAVACSRIEYSNKNWRIRGIVKLQNRELSVSGIY